MMRSRVVLASAGAIAAFGVAVAAAALFLGSARAAVGPLPPEALILPADARFVGGFDVKRFVASPFYAKYAAPHAKSRPETFRDLEEKTGLNPERDLDEVVFAGGPGGEGRNGMAVVLGRFDRAKLSRLIETEKKAATWKKVYGTTVYLFNEGTKGAGALAFLDDRALVIGSQAAVEAGVKARAEGGATLKSNAQVMALLERVRAGSTFWMVGDQSLLQNVPQNLPAPGGQGQVALPGLKSVTVVGDMDPLVTLEVTAEAQDETAARNLADVVRGFVALAALQASQKPELKELASAVSVTQEQAQVRVSARVPYELLDSLQQSAHQQMGAGPAK